jgi:outer membrane protein TolC
MLRASLVLLLACGGLPSWAEEPAPRTVTLDQAFAYARAHQPQIRSVLAELAARRSEARVPRAEWFPTLGGAAELLYGTTNNTTASTLNVPEVDLPRIGATPSRTGASARWSGAPSTLVALTLDQQVYDFGRIAAQAAVADAFVAMTRATATDVELAIALAVEEAYHGVLSAKDVQAATEDAYRRAIVHRDFAQARVKTGLGPPIELTRAQADVAELEVRRIQVAASLRVARAALAASMGSDALELDAAPVEENRGAPAFDEALQKAAAHNPAILAATARLTAQRAASSAILHEILPNLFASATLSGRAGGASPSSGTTPYGDGWLPDVANWHLGLVLQWNIVDATVLARRAASQARAEAAQADLDLARLNVTLAAERAYLDYDAALRALPGLAAAVKAAQENEAQADARFRAGLGTNVELADAEALYTHQQLELAIGRFAVARARAQLGRVIGETRLPPANGRGQ